MRVRGTLWTAWVLVLALAILVCGDARADEGVRTAGDVLWLALPAAAGTATWMHRDGTGLRQLASSGALTLGVTYGLKYAVDAERPDGGGHSFPSGHSSTSFCSAEFLRKRYGWSWGIPAYAVAAFVGYSRVDAREHHTGDVVAGALIGVASAWVFTRQYESVALDVTVRPDGCGLAISYVW